MPPKKPPSTWTNKNPIVKFGSFPALPKAFAANKKVIVLVIPKHTRLKMLSNVHATTIVEAIPFYLP